MTAATAIVKPFPLPNKLRASSGKELKAKVEKLAQTHGNFYVTEAIDEGRSKVSYLRRYK